MSRVTDKSTNQQKSVSAPESQTHKITEAPIDQAPDAKPQPDPQVAPSQRPNENGGQKGLEPTRYGDWEKNGRCTDF